MESLKIDKEKIITILIRQTIDLRAENIALKSAIYGMAKILKPEISDVLLSQIEVQKNNHLELVSQDFVTLLTSESIDFEEYLQGLLNQ